MKWLEPEVDQVVRIRTGTVNPSVNPDTEYELFSIPGYDAGQPEIKTGALILSNKTVVYPGDVLFSKLNPRIPRIWIVPKSMGRPQISSTEFWPLVSNGTLLSNTYLRYFLLKLAGDGVFTDSIEAATKSRSRIKPFHLLRHHIPLPPPSEQRRIVEILDQADALRKKRAEADAKAARILPALFYKMFGDPLTLVTSGEGVPLGDLEVDIQNGFACGEKEVEGGLPHLRMNNIDDAGVLNLELVRTVPFDRDTERYRLMEKDVLFMGTNSEDKIGKTCLFLPPDKRTYLFSNHLIRLRVSDSHITPEYLAGFLHLLWSKRFFPSIAKRWVNQSTVAQSSLAALRIPLHSERLLQIFTSAFQDLLTLRAQRVRSGVTLDQTFAVLLHRAFTGDLTAKWREAHMKELLQEMQQQAKALELNGANT